MSDGPKPPERAEGMSRDVLLALNEELTAVNHQLQRRVDELADRVRELSARHAELEQEALLRESERRFRVMADAAPVLIWMSGLDKRCTWFNKGWLDFTGRAMEQELGDGWAEGVHPEDLDRSLEIYAGHFDRRQPFVMDYRLRRYDGQYRWVRDNGVPRFDDNGEFEGYIGSCIDITDQKELEATLVANRDVAEAASRAKSDFLANMSHELRTPLNGVLGFAQLMLMSNMSRDEIQVGARTIFQSAQGLLRILNDILDMSKIEAGKVDLDSVAFAPARLAEEVARLFSESARAKGVTIEHVWRGAPERRYRGDPIRLRQMLSNLVSNAVKFSERGAVSIEGREAWADDDEVLLEFSVTDEGAGIPEDKQPLLFQPFSQTDSSTTRRFGGTGLGLSIVRRLARLMGGDVGVESGVGRGSRFWFRARVRLSRAEDEPPAGLSSAVAAAPTRAERAASPRALLVEDNGVNQAVIGCMLEKLGLTYELAENGQEALDALMAGASPDLVLMDCQMPVMDGYEATARIRAWEDETGRSRLTIIALTAAAYDEDRERCFASGMDDYVVKPVDFTKLADVVGARLRSLPTAGRTTRG